MPWNPILKYPEVIRELNSEGYKNQVGIMNLRNSIMKTLGTIRNETIANHLRAMEQLGYIKDTGQSSIFYLCKNGKANDFSHVEVDIKEEVNELLDKIDKSKPEEG